MKFKFDWKLAATGAGLACALALGSDASAGPTEKILKGTGYYAVSSVGEVDNLQPSCVQLITGLGQVKFSGFITNETDNGQFATYRLQDSCAKPIHGTFRTECRLKDATVGGVKGDLVIELEGVFETAPPQDMRSQAHGTVIGTSGGLAGAKGTIQVVRQATENPALTYFVEIHLK